MTVQTHTAPELTAEQVVRVLVQPLEAASQSLSLGARIFDTASPIRIPNMGGPVTDPGWTGESEAIPERDVDFDEVSLLPSTMASIRSSPGTPTRWPDSPWWPWTRCCRGGW